LKATIELGEVKSKLLSASELNNGDIVHFIGGLDSYEYPLIPANIRLVNASGVFDLDGDFSNVRDSDTPMYTKLPAGTKITLEVTE
jgi:hypothetical protein